MREALRVIGSEATAIVRQGALMLRGARDGRARAIERLGTAERVVVFVHGFGAAGPVFDPMREHVEEACGVATLDFTYPSSGSFHAITTSLAALVAEASRGGRRLDLVGHSLGGLLSRWYVQEQGGAAHVERIVTLATPHAGTGSARFAVGPLARVLRPGSAELARLASGRGRAEGIAHTALVAGKDVMVTPPASAAALPGADVRWFDDLGHNAMLFDPRVHAAVAEALGPL